MEQPLRLLRRTATSEQGWLGIVGASPWAQPIKGLPVQVETSMGRCRE